MTDTEMALALGEYINGLLARISALEGVFTEYRVMDSEGRKVEIPWKRDSLKIAQETSFLEIADAQSRSLRLAVDGETQGSALILALHNHFLEG